MEQEFETYKLKVNRLFEQPRFIILSQEKDMDERKKTEMTLNIIKAVVVRFIKTILIKNKNIKGEKNMKIRLNENEKVVKMVKEGLKKKNGYCPCRLEMNEDTKCMCKEFREQIADENFEGYCHCMLYYKSKD